MWKMGMIVATLVSSAGLLGYQGIVVGGDEPIKVKVEESVGLDEVKRMGDALVVAPLNIEPMPKAAGAAGAAPVTRSEGGLISVPRSAGKGAAPAAKRSGGVKEKRAASKAPARTQKAARAFRKGSSAVSAALSKNFHTKADFGFSGKVKKVGTGKKVRTMKTRG